MNELNLMRDDSVDTANQVRNTLQFFDLAITPQLIAHYAEKADKMKKTLDQIGAEVSQRQDKLHLINDVLSDINLEIMNSNSVNKELDISQNAELQEKLHVLLGLGVKIKLDQKKFNQNDRDLLIANLQLQGNNWDAENKNQTQKMDILIKELDRVLVLLREMYKIEKQSKDGPIRAMGK